MKVGCVVKEFKQRMTLINACTQIVEKAMVKDRTQFEQRCCIIWNNKQWIENRNKNKVGVQSKIWSHGEWKDEYAQLANSVLWLL